MCVKALRLRSSHPNIFTSQIFAFCIFASASYLRTFASQILTSQIFISYIFISADRRISDLHIFYPLMCVTSAHLHIQDPHVPDFQSCLVFSHLHHICASSFLRSLHFHFHRQIFMFGNHIFCLYIFGSSSRSHTIQSHHLQNSCLQLDIFTSSKLYIFKHHLLALGPTIV